MRDSTNFRKFRFLYILPCFFICSSALMVFIHYFGSHKEETPHQQYRKLLEDVNDDDPPETCIKSGIYSFPTDFFTQEQRRKGGVLVHFFITLYVCAIIAIVCDRYFIPALEIIAEKLKLPPDVAGATFMAVGASSPELFSAILGSFVTEGDIGVGAVIGSAVFNILGITGVAGVYLWKDVLEIDWYPMARDCIAYGITVICLTWIIADRIVTWWESLILLILFVLYIVLMYFNGKIEKCSKEQAEKCSSNWCCCPKNKEKTPLLGNSSFPAPVLPAKPETTVFIADEKENIFPNKTDTSPNHEDNSIEVEEEQESLCTPPSGGCSLAWWLLMLPATFLVFLTIPNCTNHKFRKLYPITFLMSIAWLGVLSYLAVWMVTVIGYTLYIPDSVSGLTILAVGASVPDLISSVLVAKSGEGNMAISNLVGSNTFDISICLGFPWLVKALMSKGGYLQIQSSALAYATATLIVTLIIFYMIFSLSNWRLNRTVGYICLVVYILFVTFACLFEFNVFGEINLPTCYP